MPTDADTLTLHGVRYAFPGGRTVVDAVDLDLAPGDVHCLLGRSGCGKTTLLRIAAGLLLPDTGHVSLDGKVLHGPSPRIGFVFQQPALLEWLPVIDNVLLSISLQRRLRQADRDAAMALLHSMGIAETARRYPRQLSGGQQSRVALARALLPEPGVLLMDEPFAALDALSREALQDALRQLLDSRPLAVLFVTHDVHEAVYLGTRLSLMDAGSLRDTTPIALDRDRDSVAHAEACRWLRQQIRALEQPA